MTDMTSHGLMMGSLKMENSLSVEEFHKPWIGLRPKKGFHGMGGR